MSDFNDFKGKAGVFASRAAGVAKGFASKTKQLGRVAKLNMDIASEKDAIRRAYEEMGRLYYENHREAPEGLLAHACQSIDASLAAIAAMEEEISQLKEKEETPEADFQTVVDQTEAEAAPQEPEDTGEESQEESEEDSDIEVEIEVDLSSDEPAGEDQGLEIEIEIPAEEEPAEEEPSVDIEISLEETPNEEDAPIEEAPTEEETPAEEPFAEEPPEEIPAEDAPVEPAVEE